MAEELKLRLERYEAGLEILLSLIITGCFWGASRSVKLWVRAIQRLANRPEVSGSPWLLQLRLYPALLLRYGAGIAAIAAEKFDTLAAVLVHPIFRQQGTENPLILKVHPGSVLSEQFRQLIPKFGRNLTPMTERVFHTLWPYFSDYLVENADYERTFDWFEYVSSLVQMDLILKSGGLPAAYPGAYVWRSRDFSSAMARFESEINEAGAKWPPLQAGLLDGSIERANAIKVKLREFTSRLGWP